MSMDDPRRLRSIARLRRNERIALGLGTWYGPLLALPPRWRRRFLLHDPERMQTPTPEEHTALVLDMPREEQR